MFNWYSHQQMSMCTETEYIRSKSRLCVCVCVCLLKCHHIINVVANAHGNINGCLYNGQCVSVNMSYLLLNSGIKHNVWNSKKVKCLYPIAYYVLLYYLLWASIWACMQVWHAGAKPGILGPLKEYWSGLFLFSILLECLWFLFSCGYPTPIPPSPKLRSPWIITVFHPTGDSPGDMSTFNGLGCQGLCCC